MKFWNKKSKKDKDLDEIARDTSAVHPEDLSDMPPFEEAPSDSDDLQDHQLADEASKGFMTRILSRVKKRKPGEAGLDEADADGLSLDKGKGEAEKNTESLKDKIAVLFGKKGASDKSSAARGPLDASGLAEIATGNEADYEFDTQQTLKIWKKKVVLGMLWDSTRPGESVKQQAKAVSSEDVYYSLAAQFKDANQIGFSDGSNGIKPGFKAGVTCFNPDQMGDSWVAAFRIGENADVWWVVALRNGQVYEDQILRDADEARMLFLENMQAPDWQRRIAPDYWEIGGTEDYRIQDVLAPSFGIGLKAVNPFKTYLPRIIAAGVLVVLGVVAYMMYQSHLEDLKQQERELKAQRDASIRISPADYPWFDAPAVFDFIDACTPAIENAMRFIPGWRQDVISCKFDGKREAGIIMTSWTNVGGTVPWFTASFAPDEMPSISADGQSGTLADSVAFDVETEVLAEPWEGDRIERVMRRRLQTTGARLEMTAAVQRITPEQRVKMREPVFNFHQVSFQTSGAIEDYLRLFGDIPAIVPVEAIYDLRTYSWNISFRIYHPAVLPI